jgi:hypothetical protein
MDDRSVATGCLLLLALFAGCGRAPEVEKQPSATRTGPTDEDVFEPQVYEASAEQLLAARLDTEEASQGWIRLFDGHTLFGWEITGKANWRVENGTITVDRGQPCLLCSSSRWKDFELRLEFNAEAATNSGVFLRTPLEPEDPKLDCYEINIAPDDHPFPTGSVVERARVDSDTDSKPADSWRVMQIRLEGKRLEVTVDGQLVSQYTDDFELSPGRIGLQHNRGRVAFRDVRLRPLGLKSMLDKDLSQWKKYPEMPGEFTTNAESHLRVRGGRAQLESRRSYDDFVMLAEYKMGSPEMNSGIFFRCIPGEEMLGYECQISNEMKDRNPLTPADCGTGGIFRRQDARIVAGEPGRWATVLLTANGPGMAAWVNGLQVSNWYDTRPPEENPREGMRLEAGTIMIQGHDPGTDVTFRQLAIASLAASPASDPR